MRISIITVARNCEDTIADTVQSVIGQTYKNVEHIIIDGASEDGTLDALKPFANNIAKIVSEPDKGIYDAMNKGISLATGDIIGILNADDVFDNDSVLADIADVFMDDDVDGCFSDLVYVANDDLNRIVRYWKSSPYKSGCFKKGWMPPHPTFYIRKSSYEKYGLYDLNYKIAADYELIVRYFIKHRMRTAYIPKVTVRMRMGGVTNKSLTNMVKQNVEIFKAWHKHDIRINPAAYLAYKAFSRLRQFYYGRKVSCKAGTGSGML